MHRWRAWRAKTGVFFFKKVPEMVEPDLHGPVEVCLFSSLLGYFLSFPQGRSFCFSCWSRIGSSGKLLVYCSRRILEYTLFVAFSECICRDCLESVTASWLVSTLLSIHFLHSGVVNLKNLFLRLSVLQSISGIFSRFFFCIVPESFLFRIIFHHFSVSNRTITRCLGKFSFVFPSVSSAVVSCFCTKLFGICTKQNIFCTKTGGNSSMFFLVIGIIFMFFPVQGKKFFFPFSSFSYFSRDFPAEKSAFSGMNFPSGRIFFHLSGAFSYGPDARALARA